MSLDKVKILTVDNRKFIRGVKEAIYIRVMEPSLNKDGVRYLLLTVWPNLLRARVHAHPLVAGPPLKFRPLTLFHNITVEPT